MERPGFFERQFGPKVTREQNYFDVAFGVVLPILCFIADPGVLKGGIFGPPMLAGYQLLVYAVSAIEIAVLIVWLLLRRHLTPFSAPIGGVLLAGGIFSTAIGVVLLPFSLLGLIYLIGIAGFTPLLTGLVYLRNGFRALRAQLRNSVFGFRFAIAAVAATIVIGLPFLLNMQLSQAISTSVATFLNGDAVQSAAAADRLRSMSPLVPAHNLNTLVTAYTQEPNQGKKEQIKQLYRELSGEDIEHRLVILND
jgi:hypothetical protein